MGNQQNTGTSNVGYFNINLKKVGDAHNFCLQILHNMIQVVR